MNGIWNVIQIKTFSYDSTEVDTQMFTTKEKAEESFYKICKKYLDDERDRYIEELILNNEVSYSDIKEIAMNEGEYINYNYEDNDDEKIFTIRKEKDDSEDEEEYIIRMYYCEFNKEPNTQYFPFNDDSDAVDKFFEFLVTSNI